MALVIELTAEPEGVGLIANQAGVVKRWTAWPDPSEVR